MKSSPVFNFGINVSLHVILIFLFLSGFFFFYITKLETSIFNQQIDNFINEQLKNIKINENDNQQVYGVYNLITLSLGKEAPQKIVDIFKPPSDLVEENNKWLFRLTLGICIFLILLFIMVLFIKIYSCNYNVPLFSIIIENIVIFIFVGIVEFLFFKNIASKYVPIKPSLMINTIIDTFTSNLKKDN